MEDRAIVVAVLRVHRKVLHRLRALLEEELDHNVAHGRVDRGLLAEGILSPDRGGHGSIFLGRLLVEDVAAVVARAFRWLSCAEEEEPLLLVGRANGQRVYRLLGFILAFDHRNTWLHFLPHGLALEQSNAKKSLGLLHLAQDPAELVCVDVHDLYPHHGWVDKEVAGLVEDCLLIHECRRLPHLLLNSYTAAKVKAVEVELCHVGITLGRSEHLQRLIVCTHHFCGGEAEDPQSAILAGGDEHGTVRAYAQGHCEGLVLQQLIEVSLTLEGKLEPSWPGLLRGHLERVRIPEL
mmetsp:Transcript_33434/g.73138  ORF Transcript_33434/g.73138 Transcript_33434/m.73138 type:complete len:294 (+) Transcript_33434:415-1296(+)